MKINFAIIMLAGMSLTVQAQTTTSADSKEWLLGEGRRLFADKEYFTTLQILEQVKYKELNSVEQQEYDYLKAVSEFALNAADGRARILQYLADYPESAKKDLLASLIAESYYFDHKFDLAVKRFEEADFERLENDERERAQLYYALSLQECGRNDMALNLLNSLKLTSKRYASDAIFHIAVIDYHNDRLQPAYEGFKSIEMDDKYYLEVPYYLAGIYLKNREYLRAEKVATLFLEHNADKKQGTPMRQILGAALFGMQRYAGAIAPLKQYIDECKEPQRIAYYQLGMSYFATGRYNEAIPMLDKCTDADDAIAQNAYLHQGIIQLKFNDLTKARLAFEQASTMHHDGRIREEALYNYALCIHQTRYSPFAESVKVFERFLNEYPASPHAPQVEKYLVEVYMNTRNYDVALQSIEKIKSPSSDILEAKQKVLYRMGVQAFIDNRMETAAAYMSKSVELSRYNRDTHSDALFWRGEAHYRMGNTAAAANDYRATLALSPRNSAGALYGLAYTQFQEGDYNASSATFGRYLQTAPASLTAQRADAYNRIGDCHFYKRDYVTAEQFYAKAAETDKEHSDYALYRSAVAQGLLKDYTGKVETLQRLTRLYPASSHAEQAYYEMGRAYVAQDKNNEAVKAFEELVKRYPNSSLARRAATETAMIYNREGNQSKAISAYKQIIRDYPHSEEAQIAAQDLKNIYVEQGRVNEYAAYAASTPGLKAVESSERDTLTYIAAEKAYSRKKYDEAREAFNGYLKEFPDGSFTLDSHYYLGLIYYNRKAESDALKQFEQVIAYPDNKYSEDAMALASEIYLADGKLREAFDLYKKLVEKTGDEERRRACRMNMMRCAQALGEDNEAVAAATALLDGGNLSPEWEREAIYTRAKVMLKNGRHDEAVTDLAKLADDTRSKQGAEAKYLLAQIHFDRDEYDKCEKEILNYIETGTPHAYWMARSFVLLSDLYIKQGRTVEAKQYLLSLQNNYNGNDDIAGMIKTRLDELNKEKTE